MAYLIVNDSTATLVDAGNPLSFGPLNRDDEEVSPWQYATVLTDNGVGDPLVTSGNTTVNVVDATGPDSSALFQLAPWTAGDTVAPQATPEAYGDPLVFATVVDNATGVNFWIRRKAGLTEEPGTDTTAVINISAVVVPA